MLVGQCFGRAYPVRCPSWEKPLEQRQAEALAWKQVGFPSMIGYVPTCTSRKVARGFALVLPLCLLKGGDEDFDL